MQGPSMKQSYATVKSDAEYQKRKAFESHQVKAQAVKRARADENAGQAAAVSNEKTSALVEELLESRLFSSQQPLQPTGPTDFSGLFPKAGGTPLGHAAAQQQPAAAAAVRAARTFEDLASQRQSRPALGHLPGDSWLPPVLPAPHADATNLTSTAAGAAGDRQLPPSATAPLDWSLKTTVRFSSPTPFAIADEAAYLSGSSMVQVQRACAAGGANINDLSMQQRFAAALHSWQFPQDPRSQLAPAGGSAAGSSGSAGLSRLGRSAGAAAAGGTLSQEALQRRQDWQAAFASLYDALRSGACDAFYYLSPQGSKKPFATFFGAAGVGGRPRLHALLTRSTAGLRALLAGGLGLGFAAPLLPADMDRRAAEHDLAAVPLDGSQSLLAFEGALRVHGLFDFLVNESFRSHGDACDVPLLLAPVQFAHASLRAFQPKMLGISDAQDPGRAQHRLELRGVALPPWVLDRVAAVLAITQDGNFSLACDTHPLTLALNWCPGSSISCGGDGPDALQSGGGGGNGSSRRGGGRRQVLGAGGGGAGVGAGPLQQRRQQQYQKCQQQQAPPPQQLSDHEAQQRGCWDGEEAARWRVAAQGLSCNVVRELRCEGGMFVAKLSAKSAERIVL